MQPLKFNPITQHYVIELTGGTGKVESRRWRLAAVFMLVFSVFHLTSPMVALSQPVLVFDEPMTITGSTGSVDEANLDQYEVRNQFATIRDTVTSAVVTYRYNIVPVDGLLNCENSIFNGHELRFEPNGISLPCSYNIRIRYRDTGANQNVIVRLRAANTEIDGVTTVYEFNSDAPDTFANPAPANVDANQTVDRPCLTFPSPHVTHGNRVYFLEVVITKLANDDTQSPGFIAFVIGSATCAM